MESIIDEKMIKTAIIETVAFFDLFDYPLTVSETWKYLSVKSAPEEVTKILNDESLKSKIFEKDGFYFFSAVMK